MTMKYIVLEKHPKGATVPEEEFIAFSENIDADAFTALFINAATDDSTLPISNTFKSDFRRILAAGYITEDGVCYGGLSDIPVESRGNIDSKLYHEFAYI